jgi:hypothetical protein
MNLWRRASVTLAIKNRLVGGIPTSPKLIEGWIAANMPEVSADERAKLAEKTVQELPEQAEEAAKSMWTTFKRNSAGAVYIEGRNVKAMFKEAANVLREVLIKDERAGKKAAGEGKEGKAEAKSRYTNLKSKLAERLFIEQDEIPMLRDGKAIEKPDGNEERAIHVMTAMGPRSALKRVDFVNAPAVLKFSLRYLNDGVVDVELIKTLLEYAAWNGMGADRSQGNGLFELVELQPLD